jgi:hypothetical protein
LTIAISAATEQTSVDISALSIADDAIVGCMAGVTVAIWKKDYGSRFETDATAKNAIYRQKF